jgi:lipopolysaccharide/colanic/teichoic acid biosynthesis glycosyltransferase
MDKDTWDEIKSKRFDLVILSENQIDTAFLSENIETIINSETKFLDIVKAYEKILVKIPSKKINKMWFIVSINGFRGYIYEITKRVFEILFSIIILVAMLPILVIIYAGIKIQDGGPFIYSQIRIGKNGKPFKIYKIRSMVTDSEKDGVQWAKDRDVRITKIGKFIRASHIDESMQLLNIIKGEISLVGPRPERPEFINDLEKNINNYSLRHVVKPGITGWAQINYKYGNSIEDTRQKFEYDLYYVKNRSIFMDISILIRTIQKIFLN